MPFKAYTEQLKLDSILVQNAIYAEVSEELELERALLKVPFKA
jgi:hypothetical protein